MGAGYAVGVGPVPLLELSAPVGGPLSTLRSEAASLHALLLKTPSTTDLLVFIDSLVLLLSGVTLIFGLILETWHTLM